MKDKIFEIWNEYKSFLKEKYPPKKGEQFEFTCDIHRRLDAAIFHLYSAGEEVWNKEAIELVRRHIPNNALAKDYILELLTRPTVSEGEIDEMAEKWSHAYMTDSKRWVAVQSFIGGFKAAIKELKKKHERKIRH